MTTVRLLLLVLLGAAASSAQTYSQPVREVHKEAYGATAGTCHISWGVGSTELKICQLAVVPADKILTIRQISVTCSGRTGDSFAAPTVSANISSGTTTGYTVLPLQSTTPSLSPHQVGRIGLHQIYQHAGPGQVVNFHVTFDGQFSNYLPASCNAAFQGYFLPAVQ